MGFHQLYVGSFFSKIVEDEGGDIPDFVSQNVRSNRRSYVKEDQVGSINIVDIYTHEVITRFRWNLLCFPHLMTWQTPMMHMRGT